MPEISKNILSLKNNKNLYYNMNKNIERNFKRLSSKVNKISNSISKGLGKEILGLYESRKLSQFHGAEKIIDELKNNNIMAIHKANILISKYEPEKPITRRLRAKRNMKVKKHFMLAVSMLFKKGKSENKKKWSCKSIFLGRYSLSITQYQLKLKMLKKLKKNLTNLDTKDMMIWKIMN